MQYTQNDYDSSRLTFLLRIDFHGVEYRFSSYPLSFDGKDYLGTLSDIEYEETSELTGFNPEANSVAAAVYFPLNMIEEYRKGRTLEGMKATVSYILEKDGSFTDDEYVILKGIIQEPIIGDPMESDGFATFSIEQKLYDLSTPLIANASQINDNTHPNADPDTAHGKSYPILIGKIGETTEDGNTINLFSSPTYNIKAHNIGSPANDVFFLIAGHATDATTAEISDGSTASIQKTIERAVDVNLKEYSYIDLTGETNFLYPYNSSLSSHAEHPSEFFISLVNGGGIVNPYRDGILEGGGDVVRWALSRSDVEIDHGAFGNISDVLNEYKFAGTINDPSITAEQFINDHILPFLPIELSAGPRGLRPILDQSTAMDYPYPVRDIVEDSTFQRISPLETATDTSQIYNAIRINYAYNTQRQSFFHTLYIGADAIGTDNSRKNIYALASANRYGLSVMTLDAFFIYDAATAHRVAADLLRKNAFPQRKIVFEADIEYGVLMIGDVVRLTSSSLYMEGELSTIIGKKWSSTRWIFTLLIQDNPIISERT